MSVQALNARPGAAVGRSRVIALLVALIMSLSILVVGALPASADDNPAVKSLSSQVYSRLSGQQYPAEGGGNLRGSQLMKRGANNGAYVIDDANFSKLTSAGKKKFAGDVRLHAQAAVDNDKRGNVTQSTLNLWYKKLQESPDFARNVLTESLAGTSPDFASANRSISWLYSPLSWLAAVVIILVAVFFALGCAMDVAYITVPLFRNLIVNMDSGEGKGNFFTKVVKGGLISTDAEKAVSAADGDSKAVMIAYIKSAWWRYLFLGIMLALFITGKIWDVVGWAIDMALWLLGAVGVPV